MGVYSMWLAPFGWGIFFIGLVVAIILFAIKKRFYPVMYLISIATYIFTVGFVIDAFSFNKNMILVTLAVSSLLFILAGVYIGIKFEKAKDSFLDALPGRK